MSLDLSKAFDCVNRQRLFQALVDFNILSDLISLLVISSHTAESHTQNVQRCTARMPCSSLLVAALLGTFDFPIST